MATTIQSVADALASLRLGEVALRWADSAAQRRAEDAVRQCREDMQAFAHAVLQRDAGTCDLLIGGVRHDGPAPLLAAQQLTELRAIRPHLDGATLVRLYCLAREGDLAAQLATLVRP